MSYAPHSSYKPSSHSPLCYSTAHTLAVLIGSSYSISFSGVFQKRQIITTYRLPASLSLACFSHSLHSSLSAFSPPTRIPTPTPSFLSLSHSLALSLTLPHSSQHPLAFMLSSESGSRFYPQQIYCNNSNNCKRQRNRSSV